jgi:hypothetical protein
MTTAITLETSEGNLATAARGGEDEIVPGDLAPAHPMMRPASDPARIAGGHEAAAALRAIAQAESPFVSRGDKSGTDAKDKRLWHSAGITPDGAWYRDIGGGMGAALKAAAAMDAYTLSDRGAWGSGGRSLAACGGGRYRAASVGA